MLKGAHLKIGNRKSVQRLMLCRVWALNRWSCYHEYWDIGAVPGKAWDWFGEGHYGDVGIGRLRCRRLRGCSLGLRMERMQPAGT